MCESDKSLWSDIRIDPTLTIYYIKVPNGRNTIGDYIILNLLLLHFLKYILRWLSVIYICMVQKCLLNLSSID